MARPFGVWQAHAERDVFVTEFGTAPEQPPVVAPPLPTKRYLNRPEARQYLGIGYSTLANLDRAGKGPVAIKFNGRVLYDVADLDRFMQTFRVQPADYATLLQVKAAQRAAEGKRPTGRPRGSQFYRNAPEVYEARMNSPRRGKHLGTRAMRKKPIEAAPAAPVKTGRKAVAGGRS